MSRILQCIDYHILLGYQAPMMQWLKDNGRLYTAEATGLKDEQVLEHAGRARCYSNAANVCIDLELDYVEGYYAVQGWRKPYQHAFNQTKTGEYFDVTTKRFNIVTEERFGVVVPLEYVIQSVESVDTGKPMTAMEIYYAAHRDARIKEAIDKFYAGVTVEELRAILTETLYQQTINHRQ